MVLPRGQPGVECVALDRVELVDAELDPANRRSNLRFVDAATVEDRKGHSGVT